MFETHTVNPDIKHWVITDVFTDKERSINESDAIFAFGKDRWERIKNDADRYYTCREYNFENNHYDGISENKL